MLPTARSVAARPEHVLVQTALTPTLSQWVPALIHPHVTLGPCTPHGLKSLKLCGDSDGEPSRHAPQSLTCVVTSKARSGKTPTIKAAALVLPCVFAGSGVSATPQRLWPAAPRTANCTGTCQKDVQPGKRGAHQRSARHGHPPRSLEGPGAFEKFKASVAT